MAGLVFSFKIKHHAFTLELAGVSSFAVDAFQLAGSADNSPTPVFADGFPMVDHLLAQNAVAELVSAGSCFGDVSAHVCMVAADFLGDGCLVALRSRAGNVNWFSPMALALAQHEEVAGVIAEAHHLDLFRPQWPARRCHPPGPGEARDLLHL